MAKATEALEVTENAWGLRDERSGRLGCSCSRLCCLCLCSRRCSSSLGGGGLGSLKLNGLGCQFSTKLLDGRLDNLELFGQPFPLY